MKTIVVLTDFSPISLNAVNYAADMARATQSALSVFHVCVIPLAFSEVPYPPDNIADMEKEAKEKIQHIKKELEGRTGGYVKIHSEVRSGSFLTATIEFCKPLNPFCVVMGTQGSSAFERILCGSNTINAMKHISWPLIVVPPQARFTGIKKIGLACDMKDVADTSPVDQVKDLVKRFNSQLTILYVNNKPALSYSSEAIEESGLLHEMLEDLHPGYHFLNDTDIEGSLSEFADENKLDLLVIAPKKHNLLAQLFHKSRSKKLILHTHIPVMCVHE